jgi:hypothetical protein
MKEGNPRAPFLTCKKIETNMTAGHVIGKTKPFFKGCLSKAKFFSSSLKPVISG